jgi:uroporphyrinogen-III synthase
MSKKKNKTAKAVIKKAAKKSVSVKKKKKTAAIPKKNKTKAATKKTVKKSTKAVKAKKSATKPVVKKTATKKRSTKTSKAVLKNKAVKKTTAKKLATKKTTEKTTLPKVEKAVKQKADLPLKKTKNAEKTNLSAINSTEKFVKVGVKTKKQLIPIAPQPVIEISNFPKNKIKSILISQPKPETDKNPYSDLIKKYNLDITFKQFIKIEGLPVKDFRSQKIEILEHKAVILTSRMAVDHYFRMCNEMRVTVPETMKYFCINESTAYYLQKYIQYRKRKIFFGHQTIQDLVDVIRKNREEKFLLPAADVHREQICDFLDAINIKYTKAVMYRTVSADLSELKSLNSYDVIIFFTPAGVNALKSTFPTFKQGGTRIGCFGANAAETIKKNGYRLDLYAPNPKNPSMTGALEEYLKESNKR